MPATAQPVKYVHFSEKMTETLMNINKVIQDNKSTLDSIQDMAVELTRAIRSLELVAIKYIKMADDILENIVPIMKKLPIVPDKITDFAEDALVLAKKIVTACEMAEKVLPGVEAGLTTADMVKLKTSTSDVQKLTQSLQSLIPVSTPARK
jgi:hypothetical protein